MTVRRSNRKPGMPWRVWVFCTRERAPQLGFLVLSSDNPRSSVASVPSVLNTPLANENERPGYTGYISSYLLSLLPQTTAPLISEARAKYTVLLI